MEGFGDLFGLRSYRDRFDQIDPTKTAGYAADMIQRKIGRKVGYALETDVEHHVFLSPRVLERIEQGDQISEAADARGKKPRIQ
jgi:hypothetical protein